MAPIDVKQRGFSSGAALQPLETFTTSLINLLVAELFLDLFWTDGRVFESKGGYRSPQSGEV